MKHPPKTVKGLRDLFGQKKYLVLRDSEKNIFFIKKVRINNDIVLSIGNILVNTSDGSYPLSDLFDNFEEAQKHAIDETKNSFNYKLDAVSNISPF